MKIDFCMAIGQNENTLLLAKLCFETFFRFCRPNPDKANIHLIFRPGISKEVVDYIDGIFQKNDTKYHCYHVQEPDKQSKARLDLLNLDNRNEYNLISNVHWNVDTTMQFMLENCGNAQWCYIAHNDLEFRGDIFNNCYYLEFMKDEYGQVGKHEYGLVLHNRKSYAASTVKFMHLSNLYLYQRPHDGRHMIIHARDKRFTPDLTPIHGFDNEELYTLELQQNEYKYAYFDVQIAQQYIQNVGGNCLTIYPEVQIQITQSLKDRIKSLGIEI
jgi:hypothetical protein